MAVATAFAATMFDILMSRPFERSLKVSPFTLAVLILVLENWDRGGY